VNAGVDVVSHADQIIWEVVLDSGNRPAALAQLKRMKDQALTTIPFDHPALVALMKRMKERGTIFDATVSFYSYQISIAEKRSSQSVPAVKANAAFAFAMTRLAHELGVEVSAGTDGLFDDGDSPLPALHQEMAVLVENCGFTPGEALISATKVSARALGISKTHGTIEPGRAADLVVLRADPTADIRNSGTIELVIKSGRPVSKED
jgi:imidazolonepropionase-like amidohydrolase